MVKNLPALGRKMCCAALVVMAPAWGYALEGAAELKLLPAQAIPLPADRRLNDALAAHRGKPIVINFWATWCEPCRDELPALQRFAARWKAQGLEIITVAVADNMTRVDDLLWELAVQLPVIDDRAQAISRPWGARVLPTTLLLDRRHRLRLSAQGILDWDSPDNDMKIHKHLFR